MLLTDEEFKRALANCCLVSTCLLSYRLVGISQILEHNKKQTAIIEHLLGRLHDSGATMDTVKGAVSGRLSKTGCGVSQPEQTEDQATGKGLEGCEPRKV